MWLYMVTSMKLEVWLISLSMILAWILETMMVLQKRRREVKRYANGISKKPFTS